MKPHFSTYLNPVKDAPFSHYEIQTTREWQSPDGESRFAEVVTDLKDCAESPLAIGPVVFSIYGRLKTGTVEFLCDRRSLQDAIDTLKNMGIVQSKQGNTYNDASHLSNSDSNTAQQ